MRVLAFFFVVWGFGFWNLGLGLQGLGLGFRVAGFWFGVRGLSGLEGIGVRKDFPVVGNGLGRV